MQAETERGGSCLLVTGAGGALGRAILDEAKGKFDSVVGMVRGETDLPPHVERVVCDLSRPERIEAALLPLLSSGKRVTAIVNNAAECKVWSESVEEMESMFRVNVLSPLELLRLLSEDLSVVVNISSMATKDPFPGLRGYACSKCALESTVRSLKKEKGLRGHNIVLGCMESRMLRSICDEETVPREMALSPKSVAEVCVAAVLGKREGEEIYVSSLEKGGATREERKRRRATVSREESFSAAHRCWNPEWDEEKNRKVYGKCSRMHGHNFKMRVRVEGEVEEDGFVCDIADLKRVIQEEVLDEFDHSVLNDKMKEVPTLENVGREVVDRIQKRFEKRVSVELWETEKNSVVCE